MLTPDEALYGAAYRVVFERCNPDACVSEEDRLRIQQIAVYITSWASEQPRHVRDAYLRATPEIVKRAVDRLENIKRASQMIEAMKGLPVPPVVPNPDPVPEQAVMLEDQPQTAGEPASEQ